MSESKQNSSRVVELDAMRALAAINLMLFHFTHVYQVKYGFSTPLPFELPFGKYGVQLFFMLSGFVNALTLFRKREPREFVLSRLIRIVPLYWLVMIVNLVLLTMMPLSGFVTYTGPQALANFTVIPNLFGFECLDSVTWTLQVEIFFYGILVFLFCSGGADRPWRPLMLYLILCLVGGLASLNLAPEATGHWAGATLVFLNGVLLFEYMPLFIIGILLQQIRSGNGSLRLNALGILISAVVFHLIDDHGHNPIATVILVGMLGMAAYGKIPPLRHRSFVYVSGISYSLYLLHNHTGCILMHHLDRLGLPPVLCVVAAIGAAIAIASAASTWVEMPITNWLAKKLTMRRAQIKNLETLTAHTH